MEKHSTTSTTVKADAGYLFYHCGFFCQRKTDSGVMDPSVEKKKPLVKEVNSTPQNTISKCT